ncbi:transcription factor IIA, alpha/beta subunit [Sparassis crispa]|uniref:Transcription initiation factor IIA large subunit n=1 Tax=Sparassis crispa TaxID=139825 RepID=A0A401GEF3_9APHY|nr:transcription factor IIA, alpha/beta subunit [Sparassis crispa]GBE80483.1 transcription factor IIA, alpha/beta subunit [Sparassis crispa]
MSNKIVPTIYRTVIDDVIANIKTEFDEYGVGENILADLQHIWEKKIIDSNVAEFETAVQPPTPQHPPYPPHPMHTISHPQYPPHNPYVPPHVAPPPGPQIKSEPMDSRYMLTGNMPSYGIPPLTGPQIPGANRNMYSQPTGRPPSGPSPPAPTARYPPPVQAAQTTARIPQVDGPSSSSSDSSTPPPSQAPRSSHPSLPQPSQNMNVAQVDDEAINSDLDDSDSDGDDDREDAAAVPDIVFCTYDKVARVKNKWKCILKDGMIHVNRKDYLFAKCTCEFEW